MIRRIFPAFLLLGGLAATPGVAESSNLERAVLEELNFVRAHPQEYARELRRYRSFFSGDVVYLPGDPTGRETREGVHAVDEAIVFLEAQKPLEPLDRGALLALAAGDHAEDQGSRGRIGHLSSNGMTVGQRMQRRGGGIYVSEVISYGYDAASDVVRQLIVDDGVANRAHRATIFMPWLRFAGVGCGSHAAYGHMCAIDLGPSPDGGPGSPTQRRHASR